MKLSGAGWLFSFLLIANAGVAAATEIDKEFHESFDVSQGVTLRILHGDGDVTITPWDKDVIEVDVRYRAEFKRIGIGSDPEFDVEFERNGDVITVEERVEGSFTIGIFSYSREFEYRYRIRAPRYVDLELRGDDGNVRITDWDGDIACELDDGDVNLEEIRSEQTSIRIEDGDVEIEALTGRLRLQGEDGDVRITGSKLSDARMTLDDGTVKVTRSSGSFDIEVEDGDLLFRRVRAEALTIRSDDGEVELDLLKTERPDFDIRTSDGRISIRLEPGISAVYSARSRDGSVHVDLPGIEREREEDREVSGTMYGGDGRIEVRTRDGNIRIKES